jgi:hypothetical protein
MADALIAHVVAGQATEFLVDQRNKPDQRILAAESHLAQ